jgi:hypothetical protein
VSGITPDIIQKLVSLKLYKIIREDLRPNRGELVM